MKGKAVDGQVDKEGSQHEPSQIARSLPSFPELCLEPCVEVYSILQTAQFLGHDKTRYGQAEVISNVTLRVLVCFLSEDEKQSVSVPGILWFRNRLVRAQAFLLIRLDLPVHSATDSSYIVHTPKS